MARSRLAGDMRWMRLTAVVATLVLGVDLVVLASTGDAPDQGAPVAATTSDDGDAESGALGGASASAADASDDARPATGEAPERDVEPQPVDPPPPSTVAPSAAPAASSPSSAGEDDTDTSAGTSSPTPSTGDEDPVDDDTTAGAASGSGDGDGDDSDGDDSDGDKATGTPASTSVSRSMGEDLPPCPEPGQGGRLFLDLAIDADAQGAAHTTSPALGELCPGTSIDATHALIPAGEPDPNHPDELPPSNAEPGMQIYRIYLIVGKPADASEPGGQTPTLTVTVNWTTPA